jgi:hypothetical protein
MPVPANELLDLALHVGVVFSTVKWNLTTQGQTRAIGELHPSSDERVSVNNDTSGNIKRTVKGFELDATEALDINLFRDRVRPEFFLEDGTRWDMGEFLFSSDDRVVTTAGRPLSTTLFDQCFLLGNPRPNPFGLDKDDLIVFWIDRMAEEAGIPLERRKVVGNDDLRINDPISWPGATPRMRIMAELAELAGYYSPYFNNAGDLVVRPIGEVKAGPDAIFYSNSNPRIFADSYNRAPGLLEAPNRFIAINNGSQEAEIVGVFDVPDSAPHSIKNRGFEVVKIIRTQGLDSTDSAAALAHTAAVADPGNYEQVTFDSPPDPRHDTFDIVVIDDEAFIELDWNIEVNPGGAMNHNLRKSLTAPDEEDG